MEKVDIARRRRSQRDYSLTFKLSVVEQVEQGELTCKQAQDRYGIQGKSTVLVWLRKHGKLDWSHSRSRPMPKSKETPAQTIKRLEKELEEERQRSLLLNRMIDIADRQYGTSIRKKLASRPPENSRKKDR
jgi:transposase-like protein